MALRRLIIALVALGWMAGAAQSAHAGVVVVERLDLAAETERGAAVGLSVPGAGPTVTRESALNALLTGRVESSLVGGTPSGPPKIRLDDEGLPLIRIELPPFGKTRNVVRYPISASGDGATGVLTSDSTRIRGLVSIADIANGRLRWEPAADPVDVLETLETRIDRNERIRLPLTLAFVALAAAVGLLLPRHGPRLALLALAANLWLVGWWTVALLCAAAVVLPLGLGCAAVLGAYALTLGFDAEAVALSPLGPSQAGRFYGLSNLLATLLLLPALLGAARIRPRMLALPLAALALAVVGSGRLGADGGGLVVLLVGYGLLATRLRRSAPLRGPLAAGLLVGVVALATTLVLLDTALGGSSHVSEALSEGPLGILKEVGHRLELSWHRATGGRGAAAATAAGLIGLAAIGLRRPRTPVTDAMLAAIIVSLLVNDTPTDVAAVGAAVLFLVRRYETGSLGTHTGRLDRIRPMPRKLIAASLLAGLALALSGCSGEEVGATPAEDDGSAPTVSEGGSADLPALELTGNATDGKGVYDANGCGACHTLAAAGSSGSVGPNLDDSKPSYELAVTRVTSGQGGMPAFAESLEPRQIADVAQFIVESSGG